MSVTSNLFKLARVSADARAVSRGPKAVGKRLVRKGIGRTLGPWIYRWPR